MEHKRHCGPDPRGNRRWSFADCIFDEADWTLAVAGHRVAIETKPLELLRQLLLKAQHLVSKDELMDAVWPDVAVVEASLPTAVRKLRLALGDDDRAEHLIETVPRIGYRLMIPATLEEMDLAATSPARAAGAGPAASRHRGRLLVAVGAVAAIVAAGVMLARFEPVTANRKAHVYSNQEAMIALRRLDVAKIDLMLADGWKPNAPDAEGNNALNRLLEICEWDPAHDRAKMLIIARALLDGGVLYNQHNKWGDTAYSIAKAKRYCGPRHPVTVMLHNLCYAKGKAQGDTCLATYELKRRRTA